MKLALIGHACWWVQTGDARILFDPLLYDPNQCACYEIHPSRQVRANGFADVDVIIISHRHIDHFDVQSLCSLPKTAWVLCPQDSLISDALRSIGFYKVRTVEKWEDLRFGATRIVPTPSLNPVPEYGFVVSDGTQTVWNQVDTQLTADTAAAVNRQYGRLDVVIAPWQPLLELKFQLFESIAFPHRHYADLIAKAACCDTRMLVPGACGFRYGYRSAWLNRVAFPVARKRFLQDISNALVSKETSIVEMDPGDELFCDASVVSLRPRSSDRASSARGEEGLVAFCPVDPFQNLFREGPSVSAAEAGLSGIIDDLDTFVRREVGNQSSQLCAYVRWKVVYQLIVCLERGNVFVGWDFGRNACRADVRTARATATCIIGEQALRGMSAGTHSWELAYHSGQWRFFQTVALVCGDTYSTPENEEIVDLMQMRYPYAPALEGLILSEVARWSGQLASHVGRSEDGESVN